MVVVGVGDIGRALAIAWSCLEVREREFMTETVVMAFCICAAVLPGFIVDAS